MKLKDIMDKPGTRFRFCADDDKSLHYIVSALGKERYFTALYNGMICDFDEFLIDTEIEILP